MLVADKKSNSINSLLFCSNVHAAIASGLLLWNNNSLIGLGLSNDKENAKKRIQIFSAWFFRQAFFFKVLNRFLCMSRINTKILFVIKKCLFLNYLSKLGDQFRVSCSFFGVGYKVTGLKAKMLTIKLGRSYRVKYKIPKNISVRVFGKRKSKLRFYSKDLIRLISAVYIFRCLRWPDAYKGKGIKLTKQKTKIKFREKFGSLHYKAKK